MLEWLMDKRAPKPTDSPAEREVMTDIERVLAPYGSDPKVAENQPETQ